MFVHVATPVRGAPGPQGVAGLDGADGSNFLVTQTGPAPIPPPSIPPGAKASDIVFDPVTNTVWRVKEI